MDQVRSFPYLIFVLSKDHLLTKTVYFRPEGSESAPLGVTVFWDGEAYLPSGRINENVRSQLIQIGQIEHLRSGMNICLVYGPNDCDYILDDCGYIRSDSPIRLDSPLDDEDLDPRVCAKILDSLAKRQLETEGRPVFPSKRKGIIQ